MATVLQVSLEKETLDLAAFGLLLQLDLVERELKGPGRCQPGLQLGELDKCRCSGGRENSCGGHILTVILP